MQTFKSRKISQNVVSGTVRVVKDSTYIYYIDGMSLTFLDLFQQPFFVQTPYLITVASSRKQKTKINCNTNNHITLTLKAPIATKVGCFSRLLKCLRSLYSKSVDPEQTAPIGA